MDEAKHNPLPVSGYKAQSTLSVSTVNANKEMEEETLRRLDALKTDPEVDQRWLAIGRTQMEQAWMAVNRAIFKPNRVKLPNDPE
jgi:hypothetical protein